MTQPCVPEHSGSMGLESCENLKKCPIGPCNLILTGAASKIVTVISSSWMIYPLTWLDEFFDIMWHFYFYFIFILKVVLCLFIFERQRETEHEQGRGRERRRHRIGSKLQALSCQHRARCGVERTDCEIMTWAEVRRLTDWATQAPPHGAF